jgi:hypothetical protein
MSAHRETLGRLRSIVDGDPDRLRLLADAPDWPTFIARADEAARQAGMAFTGAGLASLRRDDPLGIARFAPPPSPPPPAPAPGWLPMQIVAGEDGPAVDWLHFGDQPLRAPFFEFDVLKALERPFNALFRFRTPLAALAEWMRAAPCLRPSGLIFHMSRCGSTLVAQMLAASGANVVVSEARPLDIALQLATSADPAAAHIPRGVIAALGQVRHGASRYFLKLESWHLLCLPLFQHAFPGVPWVFLYRDPVAVLASLAGETMSQLAPPAVMSHVLAGASPADGPGHDEACVLAAVCKQAIAAFRAGGDGLLVNYAELPGAFERRILPHFRVACDPEELDLMRRAAAFDAKAPWRLFAPDADAKQEGAGEQLRTIARAYLGEPYAELEALNSARA